MFKTLTIRLKSYLNYFGTRCQVSTNVGVEWHFDGNLSLSKELGAARET